MPIAKYLDILDDLLTRARKAGADAADALVVEGASLTIAERLGRPEKLERAEGQDLGLRVFLGKRQAIVSSTDFSSKALDELAARAVAMAKVRAGGSLLRHRRSRRYREHPCPTSTSAIPRSPRPRR